jgi:hypothetical protein
LSQQTYENYPSFIFNSSFLSRLSHLEMFFLIPFYSKFLEKNSDST